MSTVDFERGVFMNVRSESAESAVRASRSARCAMPPYFTYCKLRDA
jgi:hypothetical protein